MDQTFTLRYQAPACFFQNPATLAALEERLLDIGRLLDADYTEVAQPVGQSADLIAGYGYDDYAVSLQLTGRNLNVQSENSAAAIRVYLLFTGNELQLLPTCGGNLNDNG